MVRNIIGSALAVVGAAAALISPFREWYNGRRGDDYRVADLFDGITGVSSGIWESILLPFLFAALVTLIGLVLRSRLLVALAGLIVLGFSVLWIVRQVQAAGEFSVDSAGSGVGAGPALACGGGLVLLLAAVVMSGRRRRKGRDRDHLLDDTSPYPSSAAAPPGQYPPQARYGEQGGGDTPPMGTAQPRQTGPRPPDPPPP